MKDERKRYFEQKFQKGPKCTFVWLKRLFLTQTPKEHKTFFKHNYQIVFFFFGFYYLFNLTLFFIFIFKLSIFLKIYTIMKWAILSSILEFTLNPHDFFFFFLSIQ